MPSVEWTQFFLASMQTFCKMQRGLSSASPLLNHLCQNVYMSRFKLIYVPVCFVMQMWFTLFVRSLFPGKKLSVSFDSSLERQLRENVMLSRLSLIFQVFNMILFFSDPDLQKRQNKFRSIFFSAKWRLRQTYDNLVRSESQTGTTAGWERCQCYFGFICLIWWVPPWLNVSCGPRWKLSGARAAGTRSSRCAGLTQTSQQLLFRWTRLLRIVMERRINIY